MKEILRKKKYRKKLIENFMNIQKSYTEFNDKSIILFSTKNSTFDEFETQALVSYMGHPFY